MSFNILNLSLVICRSVTMATYIIRKAQPEDCEDIVGLIKELAEYECMPDQVDMTPESE